MLTSCCKKGFRPLGERQDEGIKNQGLAVITPLSPALSLREREGSSNLLKDE